MKAQIENDSVINPAASTQPSVYTPGSNYRGPSQSTESHLGSVNGASGPESALGTLKKPNTSPKSNKNINKMPENGFGNEAKNGEAEGGQRLN